MYSDKRGFADRMKRYCELRQMKETCRFYLASDLMERQYEDLRLYYDRLGFDRIKALGYKESSLKMNWNGIIVKTILSVSLEKYLP